MADRHRGTPVQGQILWTPTAELREQSEIGRYLQWLRLERKLDFPDYDALWRWSVTDLDGFWSSLWDYFEIRAHVPYERVLGSREMPGAEWFPGARLNYAEHMLGRDEDTRAVAVVAVSQSRDQFELTFGDLREQVARARAGLQRLGVGPGDRVVAYLPNIPETLVAFLATASLGAVWATCPPEFGVRSVVDRLGQLEPKILLAVGGYVYGEKLVDRRENVAAIREQLPSLEAVVDVRYAGGPASGRDHLGRAHRRGGPARVRGAAVRAPALRPLLLGHDGAAEGDRPRPRRHPDRAPEEPRAELGPPPGRPAPVVHDDGVDDVERARLDAPRPRLDRDDRRQPRIPGPRLPVAARGEDAPDDARRQPGVRARVPQAGGGAGEPVRPVVAPLGRRRRVAAAPGRVRVDLRPGRAGGAAEPRQRRHRSLHRHRPGLPAPACVRGRDRRPLPRLRRDGVRPGGQRGRRRARRARDQAADAVDGGQLLERPRGRAIPGRVLRPLPRRLAPRRLDHVHRAGQFGDLRPLRRDAQPRRRPARHERVLLGARGARRGARRPRRPSGGGGRADPLRRPARGLGSRRCATEAHRRRAARRALAAPRAGHDRRRAGHPPDADRQEARAARQAHPHRR